jgi:holo-[acyl-carrier protein] synthase
VILGVGIDVVHVERIRRWGGIAGLYDRYFHPEELKSALPRGEVGILSLAARFAAKEAFGKAVGTGLAGVRLRDIQVINNHNGKPEIVLHDTALARLGDSKGSRVHVSLTHERDNAIAVVVIEG